MGEDRYAIPDRQSAIEEDPTAHGNKMRWIFYIIIALVVIAVIVVPTTIVVINKRKSPTLPLWG